MFYQNMEAIYNTTLEVDRYTCQIVLTLFLFKDRFCMEDLAHYSYCILPQLFNHSF